MPTKPRFVFDTNAIISAALLKRSVSRQAFDKALDEGGLVVSKRTISVGVEVGVMVGVGSGVLVDVADGVGSDVLVGASVGDGVGEIAVVGSGVEVGKANGGDGVTIGVG